MDSGFRYERSPKLNEMLELLKKYSASDMIMFGQQNAAHIGVTISNTDGTESDCRNLCGKHPAVVGVDTLSFLPAQTGLHYHALIAHAELYSRR